MSYENEDRIALVNAIQQEHAVDDYVSFMRNVTDLDDEAIYDEVADSVDLTDYERDLLSDRLGIK